jgi:hypothetical protein
MNKTDEKSLCLGVSMLLFPHPVLGVEGLNTASQVLYH